MLRTVIIDDQELCRETLSDLLEENFKDIKVEQVCKSGAEGMKAIKKYKPDFIFLDVEMPEMTGFEMLKNIEGINFEIIFTTSQDKYTIQAFRYSALDYLLKPIELKSLKESIERLHRRLNTSQNARVEILLENLSAKNNRTNRIALPSSDGLIFISIKDIVRCESESNYTTIFLNTGEKIVVTRTLKEIEELISDDDFFRVHHSHLISLSHLKKYVKGAGGYVIMSDKSSINVARNRKEEFLKHLAKGY